jgi:hypothetical protein
MVWLYRSPISACGEKGGVLSVLTISIRFGGHMPLFFTFIFLSDDTLQNITSHNFFYMMRQAFMSGAAVVSHKSHHIVVMRLGQSKVF